MAGDVGELNPGIAQDHPRGFGPRPDLRPKRSRKEQSNEARRRHGVTGDTQRESRDVDTRVRRVGRVRRVLRFH